MDMQKIARLALTSASSSSMLDVTKALYRVQHELRTAHGLGERAAREHPATQVVLATLGYMIPDLSSDAHDQCIELARGARVIEIPQSLKFASVDAESQFHDAAKIMGEAGGATAESFERCLEHLVRLDATVSPDTDYQRYPTLGYSFFGWAGKGIIGGMVRHRDGEWSLHS